MHRHTMNGGTTLSFKTLDGLLLIQVAGAYASYERSLTVLRRIGEQCRSASCVTFLVDLTGITGNILAVDRFRLMLALARVLPQNAAIALLVTREHHIPDYLLETVLRRYEIEGAEFVDRDAAIAWLHKQSVPAKKAV